MRKSLEELLKDAKFLKRLERATGEANSIKLTRTLNENYCRAIKDNNKIHFDEEAAKSLGFITTPIVGTALWETAYGIGERIVDQVRAKDSRMQISSAEISFKNPAYPDDSLSWKILKLDYDKEKLKIEICASRNGDKIVCCSILASPEYQAAAERDQVKHVYSSDFIVSNQDLEIAQHLQGNPARAVLRKSHGVAIATSALIEFLGALNEKANTSYKGINRSMSAEFFNILFPGEIYAEVYEQKTRPLPNGALYQFAVDISQNDKRAASVNVSCITDGTLDLYALKNSQID